METKYLWDIIDKLRVLYESYQHELNVASDGITDLNDVLKDVQAENEDLRKGCKLLKEDNKALIDKLRAVNDDYNNDHKVHNEYEDGLLEKVKELKAEIKEKEEQYHMLASSKLSHYPKEYKAEAEEYFEHNPHCKELLFFIVEDGQFNDDGEYNHYLYKDDAICVINNERSN